MSDWKLSLRIYKTYFLISGKHKHVAAIACKEENAPLEHLVPLSSQNQAEVPERQMRSKRFH